MKVGSVFSGIGGIDLGFVRAGFKIAWAIELDKRACFTYQSNFKNTTLFSEDVNNINKKELDKGIDVLCAGFPCQSFSVAGYRKGFADKRGLLFYSVIDYLKYFKPSVIFLENVKNLVTHDKGNTFSIIIQELEKLGYHVKYKIMNTCDYSNIPQNRERVYIVGFKNKEQCEKFEFPKKIPLTTKVQDLIDDKADEKYYYNKYKMYDTLKKFMKNKNTVYSWRRCYVRENKKNMCFTLTAASGMGGHNVPLVIDKKDIRKLTPREFARFQGFPNNFKLPEFLPDSELYKQFGNSVSVPVVKAIAKQIKKVIKE